MDISFGHFRLNINTEKNRAIYKNLKRLSQAYGCSGCRNFEKAADSMPDEVKRFFDSIGIDMKKPTEVYANAVNSDGLLIYGGFYHLCGTLLTGESAWTKIPSETEGTETFYWEASKTYSVSKGFDVCFQKNVVWWKTVSKVLFCSWKYMHSYLGYCRKRTHIYNAVKPAPFIPLLLHYRLSQSSR